MSGNIQHDPAAFMLALASAYSQRRIKTISPGEYERWQRVAACAVEYLARDAAASAAQGAAAVAQNAVMKVFERMLDILTPEQTAKMMGIMDELRGGAR